MRLAPPRQSLALARLRWPWAILLAVVSAALVLTSLAPAQAAATRPVAVAVAPIVATPKAAASPQAASDPCILTAILVNPCRPWLGAESGGYGPTSLKASMLEHEARIGRQLDIVHEYLGQGAVLTSDIVSLAKRPNTIALVNWRAAYRWGDANGGNAAVNAQIDAMATSIKALGSTKIMLTVFHEPENDISPGGGPVCSTAAYKGSAGTTSEYVDMWHTVRSRFDALGVTNVVWVMNYMGWENWNCTVKALWPGNSYVDWVMWDPYPRNATWSYHVGGFYKFLTQNSDADHDFLSKPWGLAEFGCVGDTQQLAYNMYDDAKKALDNNTYPKLKAYLVWDNKTASSTDVRVGYNRQGVADPVEQQHYNAFANDPIFTGNAAPAPDQTAPTASLTSPASGDAVGDQVTVTGMAQDDTGVTAVDLLVDNTQVASQPPGADGSVSFSWDTTGSSDGPHTVQLRARDAAGNTGLSPVRSVTVSNPDSDPPTAPASTNATWSTPPSAVTVTWSAANDDHAVSAYRVYRDGDRVAQVAAPATSWKDQEVSDSTTYTYTVLAVDAAGNPGQAGPPASIDTGDGTAPGVPTDVSATPDGANGATVTWTAPADNVGVAGYRVYRDGTLLRDVGDAGTLHDTALGDSVTYTYRVLAYDAAGNTGALSVPASMTTLDATPPTAPTRLQAVTMLQTVALSWAAAADNVGVDHYVIYRDGISQASVPASTTSWTDLAPVGTTAHRYRVTAVDAAGLEGPASNEVVRTLSDTTPPSVPVVTAARTGYQVRLTWPAATDNVGVTGYRVYREGVQIGTATTPTYTDLRPVLGKTSRYTVRAGDAAGNLSASSASVSVAVPTDTVAPTTPASLAGVAGAAGSRQVTISWKPSTDNGWVASYYLYRGNAKYQLLDGSVTSFVDSGLVAGTKYTYKVYAIDGGGTWSGSSGNVTGTAR